MRATQARYDVDAGDSDSGVLAMQRHDKIYTVIFIGLCAIQLALSTLVVYDLIGARNAFNLSAVFGERNVLAIYIILASIFSYCALAIMLLTRCCCQQLARQRRAAARDEHRWCRSVTFLRASSPTPPQLNSGAAARPNASSIVDNSYATLPESNTFNTDLTRASYHNKNILFTTTRM